MYSSSNVHALFSLTFLFDMINISFGTSMLQTYSGVKCCDVTHIFGCRVLCSFFHIPFLYKRDSVRGSFFPRPHCQSACPPHLCAKRYNSWKCTPWRKTREHWTHTNTSKTCHYLTSRLSVFPLPSLRATNYSSIHLFIHFSFSWPIHPSPSFHRHCTRLYAATLGHHRLPLTACHPPSRILAPPCMRDRQTPPLAQANSFRRDRESLARNHCLVCSICQYSNNSIGSFMDVESTLLCILVNKEK